MAQTRRPVTLILGLAAGLALVVGIIFIFGLSGGAVWDLLQPLFVVVLLVILSGLLVATLIALLRRVFRDRR